MVFINIFGSSVEDIVNLQWGKNIIIYGIEFTQGSVLSHVFAKQK